MNLKELKQIKEQYCKCKNPTDYGDDWCYFCETRILTDLEVQLLNEVEKLHIGIKDLTKTNNDWFNRCSKMQQELEKLKYENLFPDGEL